METNVLCEGGMFEMSWFERWGFLWGLEISIRDGVA